MVVSFNFHPERCVGCGACVMACLDLHDTDLSKSPPFRRLYRVEEEKNGEARLTYLSTACMHCPEMYCSQKCPKACFERDPVTDLVVLDNESCIGCGGCARRCPYLAIGFEREGNRAVKCDGCIDLIRANKLPACVAACPQKAITIDEKNQVLQQKRRELKRLLRAGKAD